MAESALMAHFLGDGGSMKRDREEDDEHEGREAKREHHEERALQHHASSQEPQPHELQQQQQAAVKVEDESEDEGVHMPRSTSRAALKKGTECPYLDTVSRQVSAWISYKSHGLHVSLNMKS